MEPQLTSGAVELIYEGEASEMHPVLQVRELRLLGTSRNTTERYTMVLSDGTHMQKALLATPVNAMVKDQSLQTGSIVQLHEFFCTEMFGRRIIIIVQLGLIQKECELKGTPRMYQFGTNSQTRRIGIANQDVMSYTPQIPQTVPFINPNSQPPSINPLPNETTNISNMMNTLNLQNLKSDEPILNQNFQFGPPDNTNVNSNSHLQQNPQLSFHQQPPFYRSQQLVATSEVQPDILPISNLNPYQAHWTIKARVASKGELRTYLTSKGEGKVFSFDLIDSERCEIRVTCFNSVAEQFYPKIDLGRVYLISGGTLKQANKRFNQLSHVYELNLDSGSLVQPSEDDNTIPAVNFNFCQISDIEGMSSKAILDVIGVVTFISPVTIMRKRDDNETLTCTLQLKDMSGFSVELTLWGGFVNSEVQQLRSLCNLGQSPILAIKMGMVNEFNGKSVSSIPGSQLFVEPDCAEAGKLRDWYSRDGKSAAATSISFKTGAVVRQADSRKTIKQIKDERLGNGSKPDWVIIKGMITYINSDNYCYTACPNRIGRRQCNKKVTSNGDGTWWCDGCNQNFLECDYRYLLRLHIQDHTGSMFTTAFEEAGEQIMGITSKKLFLIEREQRDDGKFSEIMRSVLFKQFIFKLRVKEEVYNGEQGVKSIIINAGVVEPSSESKYLLGLINEMLLENQNFNQNASPNHVSGHLEASNNLYLGVKELHCNSCGSDGHNRQNCPVIGRQMIGGSAFATRPLNNLETCGGSSAALQSSGVANVCFMCQKPGHRASYCPGMAAGSGGYAASFGDGNARGGYVNKP